MEMEPTPQALAKKLRNIVRIYIFMLQKEISKSKLMFDLQTLLKKGKLAGKALGHVMLRHHHAALGCRSTDVQLSYVSAKEYEFSCSNTPLYPMFSSRKKHHHHHHHHHHHSRRTNDVKLVKNILDSLKNYETPVEASPLVILPEFGGSPKARQLRITDSPFPIKGEEIDQDSQVDKMADEFICKFYRDLKNQRRVAALQSPSPYHMWAS